MTVGSSKAAIADGFRGSARSPEHDPLSIGGFAA